MSVTEFVGVTKDKDRGITSPGGLYEFRTEEDFHIYLHDTDFTLLTYEPARPTTLVLEFVYDPQGTPPELAKTPVVVFRFEDVRIVEWSEDQEGRDLLTTDADAPPGQVSLFDWDGTDLFTLDTFIVRLVFQAQRAEVSVHAR
jgi:hypothetical protein